MDTERELSTIMTAIQDHALLRVLPAIKQAIEARAAHFHLLNVRYATHQIAVETLGAAAIATDDVQAARRFSGVAQNGSVSSGAAW